MALLVVALLTPLITTAAGALVGRMKWNTAVAGSIAGAVIGLAATLPLGFYAHAHYNERVVTCHVTGKDRTSDAGMRIYTADCGTFVNADSLLRGKTTSGDLYGRIHEGKTYTLRVVGWRNGFLSSFPNILEAQEVER